MGPEFDPRFWFLAYEAEELVAGLIGFDQPLRGGWVTSLGVPARQRGRGIGMAMLRHAFHLFQAAGLKRVSLGVDAENVTSAARLYERAGMHVERDYHFFSKAL